MKLYSSRIVIFFSYSIFFQYSYCHVLMQTGIESVVVRGAIGTSNTCGEYKSTWPADYVVTPCVSQANATCPIQTVRANDPNPMYTTTIHYGPTVTFDFWAQRWGLWLVTNETTNTATISLHLESKNDDWPDWCMGKPKFCYWKNYTITSCQTGSRNSELVPIASFRVSPDNLNTFPTVDTFDVFLQPNCPVRCGVAGLGCCASAGDAYAYVIE